MLDEVTFAYAFLRYVFEELGHHVELVVAWEDELLGVLHDVGHFLACLCLAIVETYVLVDDVGEAVFLQHPFP